MSEAGRFEDTLLLVMHSGADAITPTTAETAGLLWWEIRPILNTKKEPG